MPRCMVRCRPHINKRSAGVKPAEPQQAATAGQIEFRLTTGDVKRLIGRWGFLPFVRLFRSSGRKVPPSDDVPAGIMRTNIALMPKGMVRMVHTAPAREDSTCPDAWRCLFRT